MSRLNMVRKDLIFKTGGEVGGRLVFLLFFFYLGRILSAPDFGSLNLALSIAFVLSVVFLDLGLNIGMIQKLIQSPTSRTREVGAILLLKVLLFVPMLLLTYAGSHLLGVRLPPFPVLVLAVFYVFSTAILEFLGSITNAYHRMDIEAFLKIFNRIAIVILGIAAVRAGGLGTVLASMLVATVFSCIVGGVIVGRNVVRLLPVWDVKAMKQALLLGLPVAGTFILTGIYMKWDLVVLSSYSMGRQEIGWYASAYKIVEALSAIPSIMGAAMFPMFVRLRTEDKESFARLLLLSTKAVLFSSIPLACLVSVYGRHIIVSVYGSNYEPGGTVLSVLVWCVVPVFVYVFLIYVNIATGNAAFNVRSAFASLIVGLLANIILIPRVGFVGAAWAAVAANCTFAVLAEWKVSRLFTEARIPSLTVRMLLCGFVMFFVLVFAPVPLGLRPAIGLSFYLGLGFMLRVLSSEDVRLAVKMLRGGATGLQAGAHRPSRELL